MKIILLLIRKSVRNFSFAVVASLISGAAYALTIKAIHEAINATEPLGWMFMYQIVGLILLSSTAAMISSYRLARLSEKTAHELRLDLSEKLLQADFEGVEKKSLKIIPVLTQDIRVIGDFIQKMPELLTAIAKALGCVVYMAWLSWELTIFTVLSFVIIFLLVMFILPAVRRHENEFRSLRNVVFEHLRGLVNGIKELTLNRKHQSIYVKEVLGPSSLQQSEHQVWINVLNTLSTKIGEVVFILMVAGLLVFLSNSNYLSKEFFVEYLTLLLFVLPSLIIVVAFFRNLKKVEASLDQIDALGVEFKPQRITEEQIGEVRKNSSLIYLEDVKYDYFDHKLQTFTLGPVNMEVNEGELLFIIGGNGSGKTSLAKLLTGLYTPGSGTIYYKGVPVKEENLQDYRDRFSALFADSHVFPNLNYLDDDILDRKGSQIINDLNISDKVSIKDKQLSQTNLSMGQRGRLSMLRALLEDKEIYLFDEWAANQDPFFKNKFYREILPDLKSRGKTVIAITHNENYFDAADRVIKLDYGVIKEFEPQKVTS